MPSSAASSAVRDRQDRKSSVRHIRQEAVSADGIAGDARGDATVRAALTAGQHLDQDLRATWCRVSRSKRASLLPDQPRGVSARAVLAVGIVAIAGGDGDVLAGEGEDEQGKQRVLLDRRPARAPRAARRCAGRRSSRCPCASPPAVASPPARASLSASPAGGLALRSSLAAACDKRPTRHLPLAVEIPAGVVGLAGLAPDALGLRRQLGLPHSFDLDDGAALRQMIGHPLVLGAEEGLNVGRVAAVLVGRREQVLRQTMP